MSFTRDRMRSSCAALGGLWMAAVLCSCFSGELLASITWNLETIQEPRWFQPAQRSMVINQSGTPTVIYGGNHLYESAWSGSQWQRVTIDDRPRSGADASVVRDTQGNLHIIYQKEIDGSPGSFASYYATNASGIWVTEALPAPIYYSRWIAVDGNGQPHLAYYSATGLAHATKTASGWQTTGIDSLVPNLSSGDLLLKLDIVVDQSNRVHISYQGYPQGYLTTGDTVLKHAYSTANGWTVETVDARYGMSTDVSMAIDGSGFVHVAYQANYGSGANLFYASNITGAWVSEVADNYGATGMHPSIAIDAIGKAHISYMERIGSPASSTLKYATNQSGSWVVTPLELAAYNSGGTTLAIGPSNALNITYFETNTRRIRHFQFTQSGWSAGTVDTSEDTSTLRTPDATAVGSYPSNAMDNQGALHSVYVKPLFKDHPEAPGSLRYATNMSGSWQFEQITASPGKQSALVVDPNRKAHVLFNELNSVQYATNQSGSWAVETVETVYRGTGTERFAVGLALDSLGNAHATYFTVNGLTGTASLHYASNSSGAWQVQPVTTISPAPGSTLNSNLSASIFIDGSNYIHLGYVDGIGNIMYATNQSGVWVTQTAAQFDPVYPWVDPSIVVRSSGKVHMAAQTLYCTSPPVCILIGNEYSSNESGSWQRELIDTSPYVNDTAMAEVKAASLAIDSNNRPWISYVYHEQRLAAPAGTTSYRVRSAHKVGSLWRISQVDSRGNNFSAHNQVGLDTNGNPLIAYLDSWAGALLLARGQRINSPVVDYSMVPGSPDFGSVQVGLSQNREIQLSNIGQQSLMINGIGLSYNQNNSYSLNLSAGANPCGALPRSLAVGTSCTILVSFSPQQAGQSIAYLQVGTNDPDVPVLTLGFFGQGASTNGGGGGGGCTLRRGGDFDPILPILLLLAAVVLYRRQKRHQCLH